MESESAQERFERLLEHLEDERGDRWPEQPDSIEPEVSVEEDEDEYVIEFDLSAYDADSISAHVDDRTLVVTAERFEEGREDSRPGSAEPSGHRVDSQTRRRYTAREEVAFPVSVEKSALDLTVSNGIATIVLQKVGLETQQSSTP